MKIEFKMTVSEYRKIFGEGPGEDLFKRQFGAVVNNIPLVCQPSELTQEPYGSIRFDWHKETITLVAFAQQGVPKSKEEQAAEESVVKAKDALKAAEDVLKRVKEKVNG